MKINKSNDWLRFTLGLFSVSLLCCATGCQIDVGGQILPSGYYLSDDVQYFAPGPEFVLSNEAAAQKEFAAEADVQRGGVR